MQGGDRVSSDDVWPMDSHSTSALLPLREDLGIVVVMDFNFIAPFS